MLKHAVVTLAIFAFQGAGSNGPLHDGLHDEDTSESDEFVLLQSSQSVRRAEHRQGGRRPSKAGEARQGIAEWLHHQRHQQKSYIQQDSRGAGPNRKKDQRKRSADDTAAPSTPDASAVATPASITISPHRSYSVTIIAVLAVLLVVTGFAYLYSYRYSEHHKQDHDDQQVGNVAFEEDAYYLAVACLIRDVEKITCGTPTTHISGRAVRLCTSIFLVGALIFLQATLVYQVKLFVTGAEVSAIRDDYDQYEFLMYGSQENHTYLNENGKHRGLPEYFQPELFDTLDKYFKRDVCAIPFSELRFFCIVLLIWTLTCLAQIKRCLELTLYVLATPTCSSTVFQDEGDGEEYQHVLVGLTIWMKFCLSVFVFIPWLCITCDLLWIGSRWLASTNDWASLVGDAVALEFILALKELLYLTLVPERTKRLLRHTQFLPISKTEPAEPAVVVTFAGNFLWGAIALSWVYVYINDLQQVLPEYKWDVHAVCAGYYRNLLAKPDLDNA